MSECLRCGYYLDALAGAEAAKAARGEGGEMGEALEELRKAWEAFRGDAESAAGVTLDGSRMEAAVAAAEAKPAEVVDALQQASMALWEIARQAASRNPTDIRGTITCGAIAAQCDGALRALGETVHPQEAPDGE